MKKVSTSQSLVEVEIIKGILAENGIDTVARHEFLALSAGAGRTDAWPELWVLRGTDLLPEPFRAWQGSGCPKRGAR